VSTGDYITALTGWAATMMALWEVNKTGRGQVVDLAQFEAVKVQVGSSRIFNVRDQYDDEHNDAQDMTVPVLGHQSGVPIRVCGVVPKMSLTPGRVWRGAPSIGQDTSDIPRHDC
jgi:crotonobetainyl-CoA:carnitine CoA-transferase CaiB-like acyl-CoA transferase